MSKNELIVDNERLFMKLRLISNRIRFNIIEITADKSCSISELSTKLNLAYTKCSNYVTLLANEGLIEKIRIGKETKVKSKVKLSGNKVSFE